MPSDEFSNERQRRLAPPPTGTGMTQDIHIVEPAGTAPPGGHYSHGAGYGDLLFVSGQLGIRPDGSHTADCAFEVQARQALRNVLAVLEAAGSGPGDVLKVTAYVVDVANWPRLDKVYAEAMGQARPARAVVPVPALHYGYLIEIEAIAVRRDTARGS
jgi:2-iminobutanoate/2-iminopropanoate deaminase